MPKNKFDPSFRAFPAHEVIGRPDRTDLARVPIVSSPHPGWNFILCVVVTDDPEVGGLIPTIEELVLIRRWIQFNLDTQHGEPARRQFQQKPFDYDGIVGYGFTLLKKGPREWLSLSYANGDPHIGDFFPPEGKKKMDLPELLRLGSGNFDWKGWQKANPA